MRIKESIQQFGVRKTAYSIVNFYIFKGSGVWLKDMPETPELCDILDEVEDIIAEDEINFDALEDALECLKDPDYVYEITS
jgi:hypothetical protein